MRTITAKFNSKCAASGRSIKKGDTIVYDPIAKKAYIPGQEPVSQDADISQAQEEAYFDNFCLNNNI